MSSVPCRVSLYDRFVRETIQRAGRPVGREDTPEAFIDVSEVAEFLFTDGKDSFPGPEDFPTLAPPFRSFWMETRSPSRIIGAGLNLPLPRARWGVLAQGVKLLDNDGFGVTMYALFEDAASGAIVSHPAQAFIRYATDKTGRPIRWARAIPNGASQEGCYGVYVPFLFAISLMHCKNVTLAEAPFSDRMSAAAVRRGRPPLVRFHTLRIQPMRQVLERDGAVKSVGIPKAMHLCRGHFKDYRESGLFGRHKGVFWWDHAVRGSAESGTVLKDYAVQPPMPS